MIYKGKKCWSFKAMKYEIVLILLMGYFPFCIFLSKTYFLSNLLEFVSKQLCWFFIARVFYEGTVWACEHLELRGIFSKFFGVIGFFNGCVASNVFLSRYFTVEIASMFGYIMLLYGVSKIFKIHRKNCTNDELQLENKVITPTKIIVR